MLSSNLQSQTISRRFVQSLLSQLGRDFVAARLRFEPWHIGLWTNYGVISWHDVAIFLFAEAEEKVNKYGSLLEVRRQGKNFFLVQSSQSPDDYYTVLRTGKHLGCSCMKFKCWNKRMQSELPRLFAALENQIFCHHTIATERFLRNEDNSNSSARRITDTFGMVS